MNRLRLTCVSLNLRLKGLFGPASRVKGRKGQIVLVYYPRAKLAELFEGQAADRRPHNPVQRLIQGSGFRFTI